MPRRLRPVLLALVVTVLAVPACAEDDPLTTTIVTQESAAPADAGGGETDCLGNPVPAGGAVMPPVDDIPRPDDVVDLRGNARVEVPVRDNVFEVRWFRVDPCTEIVFVNRGANRHNVTPVVADAFPEITEDALDTGPQTLVVATPGDYPFYCSLHGVPGRGQTGYLIVGDG
jgi:plastocyanin